MRGRREGGGREGGREGGEKDKDIVTPVGFLGRGGAADFLPA